MLQGAGAAIIREKSPFRNEVLLLGMTTLGFTFKGGGKVLLEKPALLMQVEDVFLALAILVAHGTFKYEFG